MSQTRSGRLVSMADGDLSLHTRHTTLGASDGTFDINPSATLTMIGVIAGADALTKIDTGTLVLTATNTYSGGTTINAGTLQLSDGMTKGSMVGNVTRNATLVLDPASRTAMTNPSVIARTGNVTQIGSGRTILTADDTCAGGTTIATGKLAVGDPANPSPALSGDGPITVASDATLGGYGRVTGSVTKSSMVAASNATPGFGAAPAGVSASLAICSIKVPSISLPIRSSVTCCRFTAIVSVPVACSKSTPSCRATTRPQINR